MTSQDTLETVQCAICNTRKYEKPYYEIRSGFLVRCTQCGFYYANPRKTTSIDKILSGNTPKELYEAKRLNYWGRIQEFNEYLKMIEQFKRPPGRILDIGCYEGYFLDEARKRGWSPFGVEPNAGGARFAREQLKLDIQECVLEKAGFDAGFFDIITLFASLEHVPDPTAVLQEVRRLIKPDGVLVLSVPVIPFFLPLIRARWRMFIGDHYFFFTNQAMSKIMDKTGFYLESHHYLGKSVDLETISARLADPWQPNNLGAFGRFLKAVICKTGLGRLRFRFNPYDTKIYFARPKGDALKL